MTRRYRMPANAEQAMNAAVRVDAEHRYNEARRTNQIEAAAAAPIVSPAPPAVETDTPAAPPAAGDDLRTLADTIGEPAVCRVEHCGRSILYRGLCRLHYHRNLLVIKHWRWTPPADFDDDPHYWGDDE